jgi:hypothetical protein
VLSHLKLIQPLPKKKRLHELLDPGSFLDTVEMLMSSAVKPKGTAKKAPIKKRATTKKKTTRKTSTAQR